MTFNTLDNIPEKIAKLNHMGWLYYDWVDESLTDEHHPNYFIVTPREKHLLLGVYKQAYYAYTTMTCEDCREHKLITLEIELGNMLIELKTKYGE